jgi:DNA-binding HxlR family transcriptional regulator
VAATDDRRICSIARTMEVVGEKWALLAVREVFLGNRRFDEMVRRTGAPRDTLTARLKALVDRGILEKRPYSEHPARFEYFLTPAGLDLYPVIMSLLRWGDDHLAGPDGPPLTLQHRGDHRFVPQLSCEVCGKPAHPREVRAVRH